MKLSPLDERRQRVFVILAGLFLSAITLLNVIGITKFIQLGPLALAVGVLPYPLTFLCTDLISELYGKSRANFVVWLGLAVNLFVVGVMWLGNMLPSVPPSVQPPWQVISLGDPLYLASGQMVENQIELFRIMFSTTSGAVFASMAAYLAAQFCDVYLFHFWKKLTNGKHLWLRNNGSTLVSQLVDSVMVISITFGAAFLRGEQTLEILLTLIGGNYAFKMIAALLDTIPLYFLVHYLSRYLKVEPNTLS